MAEIKIVPKTFDSEHELEGHVIMRVPNFPERLKYIEEAKVDFNQSGGEAEVVQKNASATRVLLGFLKDHLKAVEIKAKDGSSLIKSYEEMIEDNRCDGALMELAWLLVAGFRPSKNLNPS